MTIIIIFIIHISSNTLC